MKEAELQREVERMLTARPSLLWHHCAGRAQHCRGVRGIPDLVIVGSRVLFAELKSFAPGNVRGGQADWKWKLLAAGAAWEVWDDRDLRNGHVEQVLDSLLQAPDSAT